MTSSRPDKIDQIISSISESPNGPDNGKLVYDLMTATSERCSLSNRFYDYVFPSNRNSCGDAKLKMIFILTEKGCDMKTIDLMYKMINGH